ncbi:hypothetical protein [Sphingobacterium sp. Mn56C]
MQILYILKKQTRVANTTNYLDIAIKRLFSEVTKKIDLSATGHTLSA